MNEPGAPVRNRRNGDVRQGALFCGRDDPDWMLTEPWTCKPTCR